MGHSEMFDNFTIQKYFNGDDKISGTIPVIPEFSYHVSGFFTTDFGDLRPSKNISFPGEYERMMEMVGCYIRQSLIFNPFL